MLREAASVIGRGAVTQLSDAQVGAMLDEAEKEAARGAAAEAAARGAASAVRAHKRSDVTAAADPPGAERSTGTPADQPGAPGKRAAGNAFGLHGFEPSEEGPQPGKRRAKSGTHGARAPPASE